MPLLTCLLTTLLFLSACTQPVKAQEQQRSEAQARLYMARCVEAVERRRVQPGTPQQQLPLALHGQSCESPVLGDYAVVTTGQSRAKSSVIRLDPSRLSEFTLEVVTLGGQTLTYKDDGKAAAAAEQAGTFEAAHSARTGLTGGDDTDHTLNQPKIQEGQENER